MSNPSKFKSAALTKLNSLIRRDDFVRVTKVNESLIITLEFENETCTISPWGCVEWTKDEELYGV